jgi:hypothetical protein
MSVTIGDLTTEVIAEPDVRPAESEPATTDQPGQLAAVRARLSAIARQALRTRAEGFDD